MTTRLYYHDATLLEFDANVVEQVNDPFHLVLDRTAFYPTSGGQPHDTGRLGAARVVDVIDLDQRIVHVVDSAVATGPVRGSVDAERRRDHMQQHTAQHLLSALAGDRFGWDTVSVHFGAEHSTVEFGIGDASQAQIDQLERSANAIVAEARPVTVTFEDAGAAVQTGLRKPPARAGEIRVITIAGIDRSACGGTHVSRTSEIGPVMLLGIEKVRGHVRLGFIAGERVLRHVRAADAVVGGVARAMSCAVGELDTLVPARQQELKALRDQVGELEREVALSRLTALVEATPAGAGGLRRIVLRATTESAAMLRQMAQSAAARERVVFIAIAASPPTIHLAASADSGIDAGATLKSALARAGGRGGGSARVAQGTANDQASLDAVAAALQG